MKELRHLCGHSQPDFGEWSMSQKGSLMLRKKYRGKPAQKIAKYWWFLGTYMAQLTCFEWELSHLSPAFCIWHRWRNSRFCAIYFDIRVSLPNLQEWDVDPLLEGQQENPFAPNLKTWTCHPKTMAELLRAKRECHTSFQSPLPTGQQNHVHETPSQGQHLGAKSCDMLFAKKCATTHNKRAAVPENVLQQWSHWLRQQVRNILQESPGPETG